MKKIKILFLTLFVFANNVHSQSSYNTSVPFSSDLFSKESIVNAESAGMHINSSDFIKTDEEGNIIIGFESAFYFEDNQDEESDGYTKKIVINKYDNCYNLIWTKVINRLNPFEYTLTDICVDKYNNIYLTASEKSPSNYSINFRRGFFAKIDPNGGISWQHNWEEIVYDNIHTFNMPSSYSTGLVATDDKVVIIGYTKWPPIDNLGYWGYILELDLNGNFVGNTIIDGSYYTDETYGSEYISSTYLYDIELESNSEMEPIIAVAGQAKSINFAGPNMQVYSFMAGLAFVIDPINGFFKYAYTNVNSNSIYNRVDVTDGIIAFGGSRSDMFAGSHCLYGKMNTTSLPYTLDQFLKGGISVYEIEVRDGEIFSTGKYSISNSPASEFIYGRRIENNINNTEHVVAHDIDPNFVNIYTPFGLTLLDNGYSIIGNYSTSVSNYSSNNQYIIEIDNTDNISSITYNTSDKRIAADNIFVNKGSNNYFLTHGFSQIVDDQNSWLYTPNVDNNETCVAGNSGSERPILNNSIEEETKGPIRYEIFNTFNEIVFNCNNYEDVIKFVSDQESNFIYFVRLTNSKNESKYFKVLKK